MNITSMTEDGYWGLYRLTRAYGGPEEGGWWYDVGELLAVRSSTRTTHTDANGFHTDADGVYVECLGPDDATIDWARRLAEKHGVELGGSHRTRSYSSGSHDGALIWRSESDGIPTDFPQQIPHYE